MAQLKNLAERHPILQSVRGRGLMVALDIDPTQNDITATSLYHTMLERGFLVGISSKSSAPSFVRFDPALIMKEEEIDLLVNHLEQVLN